MEDEKRIEMENGETLIQRGNKLYRQEEEHPFDALIRGVVWGTITGGLGGERPREETEVGEVVDE
jgi:hypothetical protein